MPQNSLPRSVSNGQELDIVLLEERTHMVMEQVGRRQLISQLVNKSIGG